MTSKHTPGPWSIHPYSNPTVRECAANGPDYRYADYSIGQGNKLIAETRLSYGGLGGGYPSVEDEAEFTANAHLISAAPDLLAALKKVVAIADRATDEFDEAKAAIRKAEGL